MKNRFLSCAVLGNTAALLALLALAIFLAGLQEDLLALPAPDVMRLQWALVATLLWLALCGGIFWRRRRQQQQAARKVAAMAAQGHGRPWLVAWASQTGFAEKLAWQTAETLQAVGLPVRLLALAEINETVLRESENALFVVSTTGEGDAPDAALGFARRMREATHDLSALRYGVLALGDRSYAHFCAFGRNLESWLRHCGAQAHFDRVNVDNGDAATLRHWQHHLSVLTGHTEMADWSAPEYGRWRLHERRCLNPDSVGAPVFFVAFAPVAAAANWQAGDIVELGPQNSPQDIARLLQELNEDGQRRVIDDGAECSLQEALASRALPQDAAARQALLGAGVQALLELGTLPHREYSIASLPADGRMELILRQMRQPDGRLGVGSGWLTEYAPVGGEIALRIRQNRSFHGPADDRPLILIGNGTGIAGLRAHIRERELKGQKRNWLIFGERNAQHDFYFREQILGWQESGVLQRLDLAFSRDQPERVYVQDRLREAASELKVWVAQGAAIYVCGSLAGMAPAVAEILKEVLGEAQLEQMAEDGRYRRDVY